MAEKISDALRADMERKGVDCALTLEILDDYNAGYYDDIKPVRAAGVPAIDGRSVVDLRRSRGQSAVLYSLDAEAARARLAALGISFPASAAGNGGGAPTAAPPPPAPNSARPSFQRSATPFLKKPPTACSTADRPRATPTVRRTSPWGGTLSTRWRRPSTPWRSSAATSPKARRPPM